MTQVTSGEWGKRGSLSCSGRCSVTHVHSGIGEEMSISGMYMVGVTE